MAVTLIATITAGTFPSRSQSLLIVLLWRYSSIICAAGIVGVVGAMPSNGVHCTRTLPIQGDTQNMDDTGRRIELRSTTVTDLTLKETLCLNFTDGQLKQLHTIEYVRMEQQFPVAASYHFGIPLINTACICDCAGAEQYCSIEAYKYKNCTKSSVCYRTHHSYQSNTGCLTSAQSEVCCEITIEPYGSKGYTAVSLSQPDTIIVLRHRIYEQMVNRWAEAASEEFETVVNKGSARMETIDRRKMEIRLTTGRAVREMPEGMYYYSDESRALMTGARLNEPTESDMHKLGWLRRNGNHWFIRNGIIKVTDAQVEKFVDETFKKFLFDPHITVENCKGQRYSSRYNAEYFMVGGENLADLDIGYAVDEQSWVERAELSSDDRSVRVVHAEGIVVHVSVSSKARPLIVRHSSHLLSFNGTIRMDEQSNRFLNLTIIGGKGTLIGYVYRSEDKSGTDWSFSVEIGTATRTRFTATVGGIPTGIVSDRFVCLQPAGDAQSEQCKWLKYVSSPLRERHVAHRWQAGIGDCAGCNERGFDNFLLKLDPRQWLDGLNTTTEVVTFALEFVLIIASLLLTVFVCTRCVIPLASCTIGITRPPKK